MGERRFTARAVRNCGKTSATKTKSFQLREVYTKAVYTNSLTDSAEYKECLKLLGFLSKEELLSKLESIVKIADDSADPTIRSIKSELKTRIETIREASLNVVKASSELVTENQKLSRLQLKEVRGESRIFQSLLILSTVSLRDILNVTSRETFQRFTLHVSATLSYEIKRDAI